MPTMFRYEPVPRDIGVEEALAARIGDAAHLLARQYAFGEFAGDDAASPVDVALAQEIHLLDGWRPGSPGVDGDGDGEGAGDGEGDWQPYRPGRMVLEELVEQEPAAGPDARLTLAAGLRWRRELASAGLAALLPAFATTCPCTVDGPLAPAPLGAAVRSRLPDPVALAPWLARLVDRDETAAKEFGAAAPDQEALAGAAARWLDWWTPRAPEGTPDAPAPVPDGVAPAPPPPVGWNPNRLEYAFAVRSSTVPELELRAQEYPGGHLDWWAVDAPPADIPVTEAAVTHEQRAVVPTPAIFGGMPASRYWEMEDARINFGSVDTSPADLGRLLLIAFTTVYGNDWFCCPLPSPVGSLSRVVHCSVTDVFGGATVLAHASLEDPEWNLFGLGEDRGGSAMGGGAGDGTGPPPSPWFYRAASLPAGLESPPAESVLLLRDEAANLAWAVEETVGDLAGEPLDRYARWVAARPPRPTAEPGDPPADRYLLATEVPGHWYPLVPQPVDPAAPEQIRLRLAGLVRDENTPAQPLGRLLGEQQWLFEEEVPRSGVRVERSRQYTRWHDGSAHAWSARRKVSGTGSGSSGLRYDVLEPPPGQAPVPPPPEPQPEPQPGPAAPPEE
ncbi:hypothetical protein [Kitasatospora sp. MBT66]|uniref:hypothetical protein n=1 Tax=Kitasatospora sp. MBT66 TaxID=1444769 RepID=UPI0005B9118F|nr:hypothetical protein [Kitasatospora sp. MBT66]